jgi:hypothetical protein
VLSCGVLRGCGVEGIWVSRWGVRVDVVWCQGRSFCFLLLCVCVCVCFMASARRLADCEPWSVCYPFQLSLTFCMHASCSCCPHQVVFLPNYNVSEAELIIPAAEIRCGCKCGVLRRLSGPGRSNPAALLASGVQSVRSSAIRCLDATQPATPHPHHIQPTPTSTPT